MPVTKPEAQMLTTLAVACRPAHAPRWDEPGIMAAIAKVTHLALADVMMTVARAAADRSLEKPAAIGNPAAPCWRERVAEPGPRALPPKPGHACLTCGRHLDACLCGEQKTQPHRPGDAKTGADLARAAMGRHTEEEI